MSLNKAQADQIAATLKSEFNHLAEFQSTSSLNDGPKVNVYATSKATASDLQAIEDRANQLAGFKMDRGDFEFKSGMKHGR